MAQQGVHRQTRVTVGRAGHLGASGSAVSSSSSRSSSSSDVAPPVGLPVVEEEAAAEYEDEDEDENEDEDEDEFQLAPAREETAARGTRLTRASPAEQTVRERAG